VKLRIVGDAAPSTDERWPAAIQPSEPVVVVYDVRGSSHDRALLVALREAGVYARALLALEGAPLSEALERPLGPGRLVRGHGASLVEAVQRAAGPPLAIGAAAARALRSRLTVRVDPGLRSGALGAMARGVDAGLTLREGWPAVLCPLLADPASG
jgi:hypothetical protein